MSRNRFDALDRFEPLFQVAEPSFERFVRRRDHKRRNQRVAAGATGVAVFVAAIWLVMGPSDRSQEPASTHTRPSVVGPGVPEVDYVLDLDTGEMAPLPDAIIRTLYEAEGAGCGLVPVRHTCETGYSASRGPSLLAYVGAGDDGTPQIFISGRSPGGSPGPAGARPRQVTHEPGGAVSPAWSPDGSKIAYMGYGPGHVGNLFMLDLATGEPTQVTDERRVRGDGQFTPDGTSLLFTGGSGTYPELRIVPVTGGSSRLFIEPGRGLNDAFAGSLSPDGSLVTYMGSGSPLAPDGSPLTYHGQEITHAGPGRFLSNVDGTGFRFLPGAGSNPSGTWSPDGTRIVCSGDDGVSGGGVIVVDVATGDITHAVEGRSAIWLDDHSLLVEV